MAKKYYAVAVGRRPGIYDNWPAAQAQVTGFPGAKYKGFPSGQQPRPGLKNRPTVRRKLVAVAKPDLRQRTKK